MKSAWGKKKIRRLERTCGQLRAQNLSLKNRAKALMGELKKAIRKLCELENERGE